jgi:hypothetical protein
MFAARAITSAMAATTPPVMTLATSPPTWHSTTLSTLVQRMAVSVLAGGVWRVDGAAGEEGVEDAVGDLVGRFFQARGIAPLAGLSDPRAHRRTSSQAPATTADSAWNCLGWSAWSARTVWSIVSGAGRSSCARTAVMSSKASARASAARASHWWKSGSEVAAGLSPAAGMSTSAMLRSVPTSASVSWRGATSLGEPTTVAVVRRKCWRSCAHLLAFAFAAMCSATRSASAEMVHVGLAEPPVTKMLPSARNRFGTSWARP